MTFTFLVSKNISQDIPEKFGASLKATVELASIIQRNKPDCLIDGIIVRIVPISAIGTTGDPVMGELRVSISSAKKTLKIIRIDYCLHLGESSIRFARKGQVLNSKTLIKYLFPAQAFKICKDNA